MTTQEFERIKREINEKQEASLKAKGVCEQIQKEWKEKYGFDSVEDAEKKLDELDKERTEQIARKEKLMKKLEDLIYED